MSTKKANDSADKNTADIIENDTAAKKPPSESIYGAADLASAARVRFGVPPEVVQVALKVAGKTEATLTEATEIVKKFLERKVTQ